MRSSKGEKKKKKPFWIIILIIIFIALGSGNKNGSETGSKVVPNEETHALATSQEDSQALLETAATEISTEAVLFEISPQVAAAAVGQDAVNRAINAEEPAAMTDPQPDEIIIPVTTQAQTTSSYWSSVNGLNIRSAATTNSDVLGSLNNGDEIQVYEISGDWATILYNGGIAYVSANYISSTRSIPETTQAVTPVQQAPNAESVVMVWVSENGKKYHSRSSCSNMKNPYQITLDQAIAQGREACKKCH